MTNKLINYSDILEIDKCLKILSFLNYTQLSHVNLTDSVFCDQTYSVVSETGKTRDAVEIS